LKLSVVILNYNVRYFLELCLKSVEAAISNIDAEIIVIDNNSKDSSREMVKQYFPDVIYMQNTENVGFSKANNQAVKVAQGEYVCILNPDTVVSEDTFEKLIEFADTKTNLGIVGCKLIDGIGNFLPESKRNIPIVKAALKKMLGKSNDYYAVQVSKNEIAKVDILVGAFMLLKRSVYNDIEGFDEDYFMYGEDIDISYKAVKKGYVNYYYGDTTVIHYKGESTLKDSSYARRFYGAMQIFYSKHFKKNVFFDTMVWFGVKVAFLLRKPPVKYDKTVGQYVLVSEKLNQELLQNLKKKVELFTDVESIQDNSEIIFDANYLTCKEIIAYLQTLNTNKTLSFKILPKNSRFIIGSDDSINRGEVILF